MVGQVEWVINLGAPDPDFKTWETTDSIVRNHPVRDLWVLATVTPRLALVAVMYRWNEITEAPDEPSRNRKPQLESLS
jgi:hypothetical protein